MASDTWKQVRLGEHIDLLTGFPFRSSEYTEDITGIPLVRGDNVVQGMFRWDDVKRWSSDKVETLSDYFLKKDDVVLAMDRPWIEAGLKYACVSEHDIPCLLVQRVSRLRAKTALDQFFLRYVIGSPEFTNYILGIQTGTAVPHISSNQIKEYKFQLPPLPEQRAIAGILGALDDKIEVNRRMNVTLEAMAKAVYLDMVKNGDGEEKTIGDVVTVVGGSTPSTTNPVFWDDGDIHWATPKDLAPLQSPFLLETNSWITELGLQEISSGLLPVGTVLLSSRAPIGYLAITQIPTAINQGFIAIKCTEAVPNYFVLNWLKENMEEIIGRANGTTFLEISKSNFRPMKMFLPLPERMKEFVETVEPLYQKVVANLKESRTLASLRDSLLPKLMKGEIRISKE
jgi:type I restriction enzyme S subunit